MACAIDDQTCVNKDVAFGMPLGILWNIDECFDFGEQLIDDAQMRSAGRSDKSIARQSSTVSGAMSNSKRAASCAARKTRRLSSAKVPFETTRRIFALISARPLKGSIISSVKGSCKMALIVKSRRRVASSMDIEGSPSIAKAR